MRENPVVCFEVEDLSRPKGAGEFELHLSTTLESYPIKIDGKVTTTAKCP